VALNVTIVTKITFYGNYCHSDDKQVKLSFHTPLIRGVSNGRSVPTSRDYGKALALHSKEEEDND